ncbi:uncharacterized protein LOC100901441 [Galendromus occidentalis]|uniref:Uncharacterized protein LOC100901441 n=1 Tax=Galendromus occidentalis TaxID=34638 RepID=A0AAJ6QQ41_9ACAR|nr:uncharacterized protein LOC100901441 [Galendromus occidentalis]
MTTSASESLNFDNFAKFKKWKETLKTDRGLQFTFQWSRVQNGAQYWRYTCKHIRITEKDPHKFAYMLVAIENDGRVQVELNAPNIHQDLFPGGSASFSRVETGEMIGIEETEVDDDNVFVDGIPCTTVQAQKGTDVLGDEDPDLRDNAQDSRHSVHWVKKLVRIEESRTNQSDDDESCEPVVKHARPWVR